MAGVREAWVWRFRIVCLSYLSYKWWLCLVNFWVGWLVGWFGGVNCVSEQGCSIEKKRKERKKERKKGVNILVAFHFFPLGTFISVPLFYVYISCLISAQRLYMI